MNLQLNIKTKTIDVYYYEGQYMKTNHINTENLSQEEKSRIETMVKYFKDLKEEDVHVQSNIGQSSRW